MLPALGESWSTRGERLARLVGSLSTSQWFWLSQSSQLEERIWLSSPRIWCIHRGIEYRGTRCEPPASARRFRDKTVKRCVVPTNTTSVAFQLGCERGQGAGKCTRAQTPGTTSIVTELHLILRKMFLSLCHVAGIASFESAEQPSRLCDSSTTTSWRDDQMHRSLCTMSRG